MSIKQRAYPTEGKQTSAVSSDCLAEAAPPEMATRNIHVGIWTVVHSAIRARAVRTGGRDDGLGAEARTGFYVAGTTGTRGFQWTDTPEPPKYVKDAALTGVKRQRRELGLPL